MSGAADGPVVGRGCMFHPEDSSAKALGAAAAVQTSSGQAS